MSSFTQELRLEPVPERGCWRTSRELGYEIGLKGSRLMLTIPKGFETDLASVPRLLWPLLSPHDPRYAAAAVLHDYLCLWQGFSPLVADAIFHEAMGALGTPRWKAHLMFIGVVTYHLFKRRP